MHHPYRISITQGKIITQENSFENILVFVCKCELDSIKRYPSRRPQIVWESGG
jgi:hypothetical protein